MTTEAQTTEQTLAKILTLCKNNGTTLDELLKLPVLDAEGKIPAAVLRIVGALSAGHIIESGDNANGEYIRWADGTQVVFGTAAISGNTNGAIATGWNYTDPSAVIFPASFIQPPIITCETVIPECIALVCRVHPSAGSFVMRLIAPGTINFNNGTCYFLAIGKWK